MPNKGLEIRRGGNCSSVQSQGPCLVQSLALGATEHECRGICPAVAREKAGKQWPVLRSRETSLRSWSARRCPWRCWFQQTLPGPRQPSPLGPHSTPQDKLKERERGSSSCPRLSSCHTRTASVCWVKTTRRYRFPRWGVDSTCCWPGESFWQNSHKV